MDSLDGIGQRLLGAGLLAFGVQNVIYADGVQGLEPLPAALPGHAAAAYVTGAVLVAAGLGLLTGWRARAAAVTAGTLLLAWLVALHAPALAAHPDNGGAWTTTLETLALCSAAWYAAGTLSAAPPSPVARVCFGLCVLGFGALHFVYHGYVASVIPGWIPGHLAWAYATGVAFLLAGASLVSGIRSRLAATLLGAMFGSWVLLVHLPRAAGAPHARAEWTSLLVAVSMCGASWLFTRFERAPVGDVARVLPTGVAAPAGTMPNDVLPGPTAARRAGRRA